MEIYQFLEENKIDFKTNVPISILTGMNVCGVLSLLAKPDSIEKLCRLYQYVIKNRISFDVIGGLTNTYLCSSYKRDIVIQTTKVKDKIQEGDLVSFGCGYSLNSLSVELCNEGVVGYEGFVGIPGTIGAAAINNSGAFSSVMSDVVLSVTIIDKEGNHRKILKEEMQYTTRNSILKGQEFGVLISVDLDVSRKGSIEDIEKKLTEYRLIRKRDIDGTRKSLGSIIAGHSLPLLWEEHKIANVFRKALYAPFKRTALRKKIQCITEFLVLGGLSYVKHCDNLGRFCWSKETTEEDFFDYIRFITKKSNNKITLEIEIKK